MEQEKDMASLKDISKICGVSVATVSKALNDHKDIGEETKANIRRVAKEMGYSPNLSARALKTNRTYGIGVLFADEDVYKRQVVSCATQQDQTDTFFVENF